MNDFLKIIKIQIKIFNKRFKVNNFKNFILFYGTIVILLLAVHIILFNFGKYEKVYIAKIGLLPIFTIGGIFPTYSSINKDRFEVFFGELPKERINDFYLYKNYICMILFVVYILIPYRIDFIKTALLCFSIWISIFLIVLLLKFIFKKIDVNSIRLFMCLILAFLAEKIDNKNIRMKIIADNINILMYIVVITVIIILSFMLLKNLKHIYLNKKEFNRLFIKSDTKKYFGYNFLYLLRSQKFFINIYIFYVNYIFFIIKQNFTESIITIFSIILVSNFIFIYSVWKIDDNIKFIFDKAYINKILKIKYMDLIKINILYFIVILPALYYKMKLFSLFLILLTILDILLFNFIIFLYLNKNNYIFNRKIINIGIFLGIILIILDCFIVNI